jgi:thiamine-monophosphate kinase
MLKGEIEGSEALAERYRNPRPRLEAGLRLAPLVSAMMDVSDGLLIDSARMAEASGAATAIDLGMVPLSAAFIETLGEGREARLAAATAGDDYELLFAAAPDRGPELLALSDELGLTFSRIGSLEAGTGLHLRDGEEVLELPERLGWEHH